MVKGWKKIFQANGSKKQGGVSYFNIYQNDFKPKLSKRDGEGHFIFIKGKVHQGDILILSVYTPNIRALTSV